RYGTRLMRQASLRCIVEECPSQHRDRVGYRFFLLGKPQEDLLQRRPARLRPQFIHRPLGHYRSAIDDSDPGTDALDYLHYVGGEDHGTPVLRLECDELLEDPARLRIDAVERLVQEQYGGFVDERGDNRDFLLRSQRELP